MAVRKTDLHASWHQVPADAFGFATKHRFDFSGDKEVFKKLRLSSFDAFCAQEIFDFKGKGSLIDLQSSRQQYL